MRDFAMYLKNSLRLEDREEIALNRKPSERGYDIFIRLNTNSDDPQSILDRVTKFLEEQELVNG